MGSSDQLGRVQSHGEEHRIIGKAQAAAIAYLEASIRKRQEIEPDRNAVVFNIRGRSLPDNHALGFKRALFRLPATSAVTATVPCACRRVRVSMADQLAVHLLVTARHNHVGRGAESYQRGHPIGGAAFELAGKSQRREGAGEEVCVRDRVCETDVPERSEASDRALQVVGPVHSHSTGAESLLRVPRRRRPAQRRAEVSRRAARGELQGSVGIAQSVLGAESGVG